MENTASYKKEITNASWIIICRVIQFGLNFVISLLSAKYLGPERYGLTSYASSFAAFFIPVAVMGLSSTLVKELKDDPSREGEILGTSLVASLFFSVISIAGMTLTVYLLNQDDRLTVIFCALYSLSLFFENYELLGCWFQSKLMSKYPAVAALISFIVSALYRVYLLASGKGILWFSLTRIIDFGLISLLLLISYRLCNAPKLRFSMTTALKLLDRSKYYIITDIIIASFSSVDKILLKQMIGSEASGLYSSAFSIALAASFVYSAIIDSFRPSIVSLASTNSPSFEQRVKTLFSIVIWISIIQNIVFSLFGGTIIKLMLGEEYLGAIPVFRVLTWFTTFSYLGSARAVWVLSVDKHRYLWMINTIGAVSGIVLNRILIQYFGMMGAAVTAILTQIITNFLAGYFFKEIRPVNKLILQSVNPVYTFRFVKGLFREFLNRN